MRTEQQFSDIYRDAERFAKMHGKPVWIVPQRDGYAISVIQPKQDELPENTNALLVEFVERDEGKS